MLLRRGHATACCSPYLPAASSKSSLTSGSLSASESKFCSTPTAHSTTSISPIAAWCRWLPSIQTAVSSKWQPLVARVGRAFRRSLVLRLPRHDYSSRCQVPPQGCRDWRSGTLSIQCLAFRNLMLAHVHAFLEQVLISAACNGAHSLKARLARWLLMMRDRHDEDSLAITQDLLAEMLGVHRPTITNAARALQRAGLIECGRQRVTIRNRDGLVAVSCECYLLVRTRISQHLPKTYPEQPR